MQLETLKTFNIMLSKMAILYEAQFMSLQYRKNTFLLKLEVSSVLVEISFEMKMKSRKFNKHQQHSCNYQKTTLL